MFRIETRHFVLERRCVVISAHACLQCSQALTTLNHSERCCIPHDESTRQGGRSPTQFERQGPSDEKLRKARQAVGARREGAGGIMAARGMITSYREGPLLPIEHAEAAGTLREISISAPPGAVFDPEANVALPASAGSFAYRYNIDSQFHQSRNRFITWCAICCSAFAHPLEAHPRPDSRFSRALARFELGEEHTAPALPLRSRSRNLFLRVNGGPQPHSGKTLCAFSLVRASSSATYPLQIYS